MKKHYLTEEILKSKLILFKLKKKKFQDLQPLKQYDQFLCGAILLNYTVYMTINTLKVLTFANHIGKF